MPNSDLPPLQPMGRPTASRINVDGEPVSSQEELFRHLTGQQSAYGQERETQRLLAIGGQINRQRKYREELTDRQILRPRTEAERTRDIIDAMQGGLISQRSAARMLEVDWSDNPNQFFVTPPLANSVLEPEPGPEPEPEPEPAIPMRHRRVKFGGAED